MDCRFVAPPDVGELRVFVRLVRDRVGGGTRGRPSRSLFAEDGVVVAYLDGVEAGVDEGVVEAAEQDEVVEVGWSAVFPPANVVGVAHVVGSVAAGEGAAAVAGDQRSSLGAVGVAGGAAEVEVVGGGAVGVDEAGGDARVGVGEAEFEVIGAGGPAVGETGGNDGAVGKLDA